MNTIRSISRLNKTELENCVHPDASWHTDYRDTAYISIGGLPFTLTEGDILTIFSQFGEPTYLHLARDKESGKSRGFAWLKYEDQRSCDLAVDNLGGATIVGRVIRVDHARYKRKDGEDEEEERRRELKEGTDGDDGAEEVEVEGREILEEEVELMRLQRDHDDDDPMKQYLVEQKKEEVAKALKRLEKEKKREGKHKHHHRSHQRRPSREKRNDPGVDRRRRRRPMDMEGEDSDDDGRRREPRHDRHKRLRSP